MRARGFTLVEVLVAVFIMALLAGIAWRGVDGIVKTRQASQTRLDQVLRVNTVLAQWAQDLDSLQDTQTVPALNFDGATLRITRRSDTGVQVVAWALRGNAWWRWAGPSVTSTRELQDSWLASQQLLGTEPGQLRGLDGVASWQLHCYRGNGWSNCQSSGNVQSIPTIAGAASAPPVTQRVVLPTGIRLLMTMTDGAVLPGQLTRDLVLAPHIAP